MAINATNKGGNEDFELVPAGTYTGRCVKMIHIGTVSETINGLTKVVDKVLIQWELPTELKEFKEGEGEKPYLVQKEFTLSMHEKATLRKFLKDWRGKDFTKEEAESFDITKVLGKPCTISIAHKPSKKDPSKVYTEVTSVSQVMKGITCLPQVNPNYEFNYEPFIQSKFDALPQYLKDKMSKSAEYHTATGGSAVPQPEANSTANGPGGFGSVAEEIEELPF